ncbi:beta-lactamase [Coprinopsis marcescibilis]|uniref:Beta-lactamase n=1 Tax=Coprinopsis marcescibilis TaxID=230819 RepID=A0A5C3KRT3_COPMA|nr:beta-lactamase [Coprinopsis marcescibilis]
MPRLSAAGKKALDELEQTAKSGRLPGFTLAVSNLDEQIYVNAAGNKTYGDSSSPQVTPETVFWICSMTKLLASLAALQLLEQGKISLEDPVSKFFPEFESAVVVQNVFTDPDPSYAAATQAVTILHLFNHSSGLYYSFNPSAPPYRLPDPYTHPDYTGEDKYSKFFELVKGKFPGIPLAFEPGSAFAYGFSSDVLGFIVEKVTGQSLDEYSKQHIFGPIGVKNTYTLTAELKDCMIDLCFRNQDGSIEPWNDRAPVTPRYPEQVQAFFGGIGSYSTMPDYLSILRHLLQIEAGRDVPNAVLKRETVKQLFGPTLSPAGSQALNMFIGLLVPRTTSENSNWGLGAALTTTDMEGRRKAGSLMWSGWAGTWWFMDPKAGIALTFGSQIAPPMDPVTAEISDLAEQIVYANLED